MIKIDEIPFKLDSLLQRDSIFVGELPLCKLLLMNDSNFPWFLLIPRKEGVVEMFDLDEDDRLQLQKESDYLLSNLKQHFKATKMNVANLGNIVPQLHIHHIARYEDDLAWPGPIWGAVKAKPYTEKQIKSLITEVRALFASF
jgi:diadenosine tetraphosphate (Ap4A) HIT family hydrolase